MKKYIGILALLLGIVSCAKEAPQLWAPAPTSTNTNTNTNVVYVNGNVVSVEAQKINKLKVLYSIAVDPTSAENITNYQLIETNLTLSYAEMDRTNDAIVYLYTSNDMIAGTNYHLIVSGVKDTNGYDINTSTNEFNSFGSEDYTAPTVSIAEPVADQLIGKSFIIYGSAHDNSGIDSVYIKVDGGEWVKANGKETWSYSLDTSLYNETYQHTIYAKAVDLRGNSYIQDVVVSIDRTDPNLTLSSPASDGNKQVNSGASITFSGTASDGNNISYIAIIVTNMYTNYTFTATWTGASNWTYAYNHTDSPKDESTNYFTVVAIDTAGNSTAIKRTLVVYRDGAVCVSTNGSADGDGTAWFPMDTISNGLAKAPSVGANKVKIANGVYNISTLNATKSLFGGYSQDFSTCSTNFTTKTIINGTKITLYYNGSLNNLILNVPVHIFYYYPATMSILNCIMTSNTVTYTPNSPMGGLGIVMANNLFTGSGVLFQANTDYGVNLYFYNNTVNRVSSTYLLDCSFQAYSPYNNLYADITNNTFINQTNGTGILHFRSLGNSGGDEPNIQFVVQRNTFSNFSTVIPIICDALTESGGASSAILSSVIKQNKFYGTSAKIISIDSISNYGSAPDVTVTIESNEFYSHSTYCIYLDRNTSGGTFDIRINRNRFTNDTAYNIYENTSYAAPTYVLTNYMAEWPSVALMYHNGSALATFSALNMSSSYSGNTNW